MLLFSHFTWPASQGLEGVDRALQQIQDFVPESSGAGVRWGVEGRGSKTGKCRKSVKYGVEQGPAMRHQDVIPLGTGQCSSNFDWHRKLLGSC